MVCNWEVVQMETADMILWQTMMSFGTVCNQVGRLHRYPLCYFLYMTWHNGLETKFHCWSYAFTFKSNLSNLDLLIHILYMRILKVNIPLTVLRYTKKLTKKDKPSPSLLHKCILFPLKTYAHTFTHIHFWKLRVRWELGC